MPKSILAEPDRAVLPSAYPHDFDDLIQQELSALADIEAHHQSLREQLSRWSGPSRLKQRRVRLLEQHLRRKREPHVLRLAELHQERMSRMLFSPRTTVH